MQADDAIQWLEKVGVKFGPSCEALDLGCGHGIFGAELVKKGCKVTFSDEKNFLKPELRSSRFLELNLDRDDLKALGRYDLVICSNVFEHLAKPQKFITEAAALLKNGGVLYLSWTNWLSPFGGHDYAPLHYFGPRFGRWIKYKLSGTWSSHIPYENLYPTYIGHTLRMIRQSGKLKVLRMTPRYYSEFPFLMRVPLLREFWAWNCALLLTKA
jgi:SAM-dependent methyltransferase